MIFTSHATLGCPDPRYPIFHAAQPQWICPLKTPLVGEISSFWNIQGTTCSKEKKLFRKTHPYHPFYPYVSRFVYVYP
jgi:hypothetical protein